MAPLIFSSDILTKLQRHHPLKLIESMSELSNQGMHYFDQEEEFLFPVMYPPLTVCKKYSSPAHFLAQSSFNDIIATSSAPCRIPCEMRLILSTLDKVGMDALKKMESEGVTKYQDGDCSCEKSAADSASKTNQVKPRQANKILALGRSTGESIVTPAKMSSVPFANKKNDFFKTHREAWGRSQSDGLSLGFCHDWWYGSDTPETPTGTDRVRSSSNLSVSPRPSRVIVPTTTKSTAASGRHRKTARRAGKKLGFSCSDEGLQVAPKCQEVTNPQTVKIMLGEGQDQNEDSDTESAAVADSQGKRPNTHKKGQVACRRVPKTIRRQSVRRSRARSLSARSAASSRVSRVSRVPHTSNRPPKARKFSRSSKKAPKGCF